MRAQMNVLIAGESWETLSFHQKGFDVFTTTFYQEGVGPLRDALQNHGHSVTYMPSHIAATAFPTSAEALDAFDVVMLSDIGANTLLLHPHTFEKSKRLPNRLTLLHDYVERGGGLIMVGGYLTFQGIDAKARYAGTAVERALPVQIQRNDDRMEIPEGVEPQVQMPEHPIVQGVGAAWPALLGYNQFSARAEASVVVTVGDDPLLATWAYGQGRAVAFASDCGPHWAPPEFLDWDGYAEIWSRMVSWAGGAL